MEYAYTISTTGSSSATWPVIANGGTSYGKGVTYVSGGGGGGLYTPPPRPQTALEWLDAEVEATCKLARQVA